MSTCGDVREVGCQREQAAGAGKQVNTAISARRDVMGAYGNIMEHHGEVQSGGAALRAAIYGVERTLGGAATSNMRQELSRTIWCEDDVVLTSRCSFGTRMRCSNSYLQRLGDPAASARRVLEGLLAKVKFRVWRACWMFLLLLLLAQLDC